jgi:hypothetical protein
MHLHLRDVCTSITGVTFIKGKAERVSHGGGMSTLYLSDGRSISGSLVLDATGHSRRLVKYDQKFDPGYQGAYGIIAGMRVTVFCRSNRTDQVLSVVCHA